MVIAARISTSYVAIVQNVKVTFFGLFMAVICLPVLLKTTKFRLYLELGNAQKLLKRSK